MVAEMEYNYMSVSKNGDVIAVFALEKGSVNERIMVNKILEMDVQIKKATKEDYDSFEGEEEEISH
jgi:hypothetical protein